MYRCIRTSRILIWIAIGVCSSTPPLALLHFVLSHFVVIFWDKFLQFSSFLSLCIRYFSASVIKHYYYNNKWKDFIQTYNSEGKSILKEGSMAAGGQRREMRSHLQPQNFRQKENTNWCKGINSQTRSPCSSTSFKIQPPKCPHTTPWNVFKYVSLYMWFYIYKIHIYMISYPSNSLRKTRRCYRHAISNLKGVKVCQEKAQETKIHSFS